MEDLKTKERNEKKIKRKLSFIALILTVVIVFILALIVSIDNISSKNNEDKNSYIVTGEILSACNVYTDILLQVEKKEDGIAIETLKDTELISEVFINKFDFSDIEDFNIRLADYNNDGNEDFIYVDSKLESGYNYKFYSVDKKGKITEIEEKPVNLDIKKASVKLTKNSNTYEYISPVFYYDGYKVKAEVGKYKLSEKIEVNKKTISKDSKISIEGNFKAIPRKINTLKEFPVYMQNVNEYMVDIQNKKCVEVDLDGNNQNEYIVYLNKDNIVEISLFDESSNFLVSLYSSQSKKELNEIMEIADIDGDEIMEIIIVDGENIEIHRFDNGFYY